MTSVFLWCIYWFGDSYLSLHGVHCHTAYETVKAGQRLLSEGRHASLSSSFSEIEFGRARPTSLLHSTIHLLIPSGEERGRENKVQEWEEGKREGMKEGREVQRREREKRGKWPKKERTTRREERGDDCCSSATFKYHFEVVVLYLSVCNECVFTSFLFQREFWHF